MNTIETIRCLVQLVFCCFMPSIKSKSNWGANATCITSLASHSFWRCGLLGYLSGSSSTALCGCNAHIIFYDVTTWSWKNLVNPAHGCSKQLCTTTQTDCELEGSCGIVLMLWSLQKQLQRRHRYRCSKIGIVTWSFFWCTRYLTPPLGSCGNIKCLHSFLSTFECPNIPVVWWLLTYFTAHSCTKTA